MLNATPDAGERHRLGFTAPEKTQVLQRLRQLPRVEPRLVLRRHLDHLAHHGQRALSPPHQELGLASVVHRVLSAAAGSLADVSSATTSRRQPPVSPLPPAGAVATRRRPRVVPRWYRDAAGALTWLSMLL